MKVGLKDFLTGEVLDEITNLYDLDSSTIKEIDTWANFIFEAKKSDKSYILRISHSSYRTIYQIKAEIEWIDFLEKKGVPVAIPILSVNNQFVEEITLEDSTSFFTTLFVKVPGETIATNHSLMTPTVIEKWGSILGRLHSLTKEYEPKSSIKRKHWYEKPEIANIDETLTDYPIILEKAKKHISYIKSLPKDQDTYGLIHYDLHEVNLLVDGEDITVIDFDDCQYDYLAADFSSIFFQLVWRFHTAEKSREAVAKEFYPQFMKGYLKEYPLSEFWISKIPDFLQVRHFFLFCNAVIEQQVEFDEWTENIINQWIPMLEEDKAWIDFDFKLN
jgi:Ser/Thr protein kinase RdoA (MazF antagonist)